MAQYIAVMWTEKKGKLLQTFGPYPTENAAQEACDRIGAWPMAKNGVWEVVEMFPEPENGTAVRYQSTGWAGTMYVYPQATTPWQYTSPTITLYGGAIPITNATFTYKIAS